MEKVFAVMRVYRPYTKFKILKIYFYREWTLHILYNNFFYNGIYLIVIV